MSALERALAGVALEVALKLVLGLDHLGAVLADVPDGCRRARWLAVASDSTSDVAVPPPDGAGQCQ